MQSLEFELSGASDRSAILLIGGIVEDALINRISLNIRAGIYTPKEKEYIFRFEGPMGTHSARCELAWLFGLIDDANFQQMDILRELRNACAHSIREVSFKITEFYALASKVFKPIGHFDVPSQQDTDSQIFREKFITEICLLQVTLLKGSREEALRDMVANLKHLVDYNK